MVGAHWTFTAFKLNSEQYLVLLTHNQQERVEVLFVDDVTGVLPYSVDEYMPPLLSLVPLKWANVPAVEKALVRAWIETKYPRRMIGAHKATFTIKPVS